MPTPSAAVASEAMGAEIASPIETLCSVCTKMDFAQYFRQEIHVRRGKSSFVGPSDDALHIGSLKDVYSRSNHCSFCNFALRALGARWNPHEWTSAQQYVEQSIGNGSNPELYLYSYLFADNYKPDRTTLSKPQDDSSISQRTYRLGIGLRPPTDKTIPFLDHAADIQLLSGSAQGIGNDTIFHGRITDSTRANISLAKDWIMECEQSHRGFCENQGYNIKDTRPMAPPEDLLAIDAQRMCLVPLPKCSRYVALSYCWRPSSAKTLVTTASNKAELLVQNSLKDRFSQLPRTIQDAIKCVEDLGERYLWVDALCIVQDSPEEMIKQIRQMDRVYGSALVTIISASPEDRGTCTDYDGLPGYRMGGRSSPQEVTKVQGLSLATSYLSVDTVVGSSRWNSRAWTFQEELLSRRKLYFTETQLYFQCPCGVFCEDTVGEGKSMSAFVYAGSSLWNSVGLYTSKTPTGNEIRFSRNSYPSLVESFNLYSSLVELYSSRQMTKQTDALFAFEGIMSSLRETMGTEFIFGLPEVVFDEALLWITRESHHRRTVDPATSSVMAFPSWSWVGWNARSDYRLMFRGFIRPEVDWFLINKTGEATRLATPGCWNSNQPPFVASDHQVVRPQLTAPDHFLHTLRLRSGISSLDGIWGMSLLACWTSVASFWLLGDIVDIGEDEQEDDWLFHYNLVISNAQSKPVGSIIMERSWADSTLEAQQMFDFILLSRSSTVDEVVWLDESIYPMKEWCFVNVMLLDRHGDTAQRMGVGVVHENSWVEANPTPSLIQLK